MAGWSEPSTKLAPSFKEYPHLNIERHGVLQEMAPLGTLPSSKLKKTIRQEERRHGITIRNGNTEKTMEEVEARDFLTPEPAFGEEIVPESRDEEDEEYIPKTPLAQSSPRKTSIPLSVRASSAEGQLSPSVSASDVAWKQSYAREKLDKVVDQAVREALSERRIPTAWALRTLYDDYRNVSQRIPDLYEAIFNETAEAGQIEEFHNLMAFKKKEGRLENVARNHFRDAGQLPETPPVAAAISPSSVSVASPPRNSSVPASAISASELSESLSRALVDRVSQFSKLSHLNKKHQGNEYQSPFPPIPGKTVIQGVPFTTKDTIVEPAPVTQNGKVEEAETISRARSMSSSSSLSSLDEDMLREDFDPLFMSGTTGHANGHITRELVGKDSRHPSKADSSHQGPSHPGSHANSTSPPNEDNLAPALNGNQNEPMTHSKPLGPKSHAFPAFNHAANSTTSSASSSTNDTISMATTAPLLNASTSNFPSFTSSRQFPVSVHPPASHQTILKFKKQSAPTAKRLEEGDVTTGLKRKARALTDDSNFVSDSHVRKRASYRVPSEREAPTESLIIAPPTLPVHVEKQTLRLRPPQSRRGTKDEVELASSPTLLSFQEHLAAQNAPTSRAATPNSVSRPARKNKNGGPRMKSSPMKNKAGPSAGIPRASGERNSPVGNGPSSHGQDDNDDYCSSCGASGDLVCCDGCTRSFHLKCVDPPMDGGELPDTWFCNVCNASRGPPIKEGPGPFGKLIALNEKKNPSAYFLPKTIREYFEGVATGKEGEYEDAAAPAVVSKAKNRGGYEEPPDYLKIRDAKGNLVICHDCNQGPGTQRSMIQCSICPQNWHLDCLDPPLANPPLATRPWRCPLHVDDLLAKIPAALGPAHRFRRIKKSVAIVPSIPRGTRNNGHIEVDLDPTDDEQDEDFYNHKEFGLVYKLPEQGIKLDFLSKLRSLPEPQAHGVAHSIQYSSNMFAVEQHSIAEQQAALNLAQLAVTIGGENDATKSLIDELMAEAPSSVIDLIAMGDATGFVNRRARRRSASVRKGTEEKTSGKSAKAQRQSLKAMMALIKNKLDDDASDDEDDVGEAEEEAEQINIKSEEAMIDNDGDEDMLL